MYNDESPAVGQDIGTGLSIDPWARGNSTADKELASKIRQLLTQEETHELKALCGRCLYHTITTAVALRVSDFQSQIMGMLNKAQQSLNFM